MIHRAILFPTSEIITGDIMWYKLAQELVPEETEAVFDPIQNNKTNPKFNTDKIVNDFFTKYKNIILNIPLPAQNHKAIINWARQTKNSIVFDVDSFDRSGWSDIRKIRKFVLIGENFQFITSDILNSYPKIFKENTPIFKKIIEKLKSDKDINNYFQKLNTMLLAVQENEEPLSVDSELAARVWENPDLSLVEKYQFLQKHFGNTDIWKKYINDFKNILPKGLSK